MDGVGTCNAMIGASPARPCLSIRALIQPIQPSPLPICCLLLAQLAGQILGMAFWFPRHPVDDAVEIVAAVAEALRVDYGINKVGVQG